MSVPPSQEPALALSAMDTELGRVELGQNGLGQAGYAFSFGGLLAILLSHALGSKWNGHPVLFFLGSKNSLLKDAMAPGTPKVGGQLYVFFLPILS